MAASLSRPDPSSPASVAEARFSTARKGYQQDEVQAFLVSVAAELGRLQERERQLEAELREARSAASEPATLDEAAITELLGEETVRVLQTARESASQIKIRAEESAAMILREANDGANRLRQDTEVDVARRRQEAASEAEAEVAMAKQQGREMVNEARAYRERVLADLDRRTNLARKQIEELLHGRDRLLQVFERARLVAVDVTSELRDIDAPDELVNLTPTTGPVPLMVPSERRGRGSDDALESTVDEATHQAVDPAHPDDRGGEAEEAGDTVADDVDQDAEDAARADTDATRADAAGGGEGDVPADGSHARTDATEADDDGGSDDAGTDGAGVDHDGEASEAAAGAAGHDPDGHEAEAHDESGSGPADAEIETTDLETSDHEGSEAADDATPTSARDANVVSLFRDRPTSLPAGEDTADTEDTADAGDIADAEDRPDVGGIFARLRDELPANAEPDDEVADDTADATADAPEDVAAERPDTAFTRRDEALVPLIVTGARKIKRVLADEQNLVLDRLRQKAPVTSLDDVLAGLDEHAGAYADAIADELAAAAAAGAGEVGVRDTRTLRVRLGKAGALDDARTLLRTGLIVPLRDRLDRSVADGAGDNEEITQRVRAVYREWKTQHIDAQLDDVFRYAHGGGLIVSAEPGTPMIWTIDPDEHACPDCEDNSLAGAVPSGQSFPTGHTTAPAHPGCRCLVLPS